MLCIIARQNQSTNFHRTDVQQYCKICFAFASTLHVQVDFALSCPFPITLTRLTDMIFLTVPFAEKDQAKALGARWNAAQKKWYVPDGANSALFEKWQPQAMAGSAPAHSVTKGPSMMEVGLTITGEKYLALDHDCVPWEPCAHCDETIATYRASLAGK